MLTKEICNNWITQYVPHDFREYLKKGKDLNYKLIP